MYRREAYKLANSTNTWRAMLSEYWEQMTIHFIANSRTILTAWETGTDKPTVGTSTWAQIQTKLIDKTPTRLVRASTETTPAVYQPLPMWGTGSITLDPDVAPNKMSGTIQMLRSVASFDVYVQKKKYNAEEELVENTATRDFTLTDLYAVYAADQGYLGAKAIAPPTTPATYEIPGAMKTTVGIDSTLRVNGVKTYTTPQGEVSGIAYQMYVYDNYASTVPTEGPITNPAQNRPTRLIVAGYYKQTGDPSTWKKSYYPIDVTDATDHYRKVIRNWKYEFMITSVSGPGVPTFEGAIKSQTMDLNIEIISWNKSDVKIGATGKYYVTMLQKTASLWREAGASETLELDYVYLDGVTNNDFTIDFKKNEAGTAYFYNNGTVVPGTPSTVGGVTTTTLSNEWFEVTMRQTPATGGGAVMFEVKAKKNCDLTHCKETIVVKYRNLEFEIDIDQYDISLKDWQDGGEIPADV
jgi:hypothetical protein